MTDCDLASEQLQQLESLGVKLAIDDFGTGYSSLSYLHRFAVDIVKLDRSLVTAMDDGEQGPAVARAVATIAESLDLTSVAEGIETAEQLAIAKVTGVRLGSRHLAVAARRRRGLPQPAARLTSALIVGGLLPSPDVAPAMGDGPRRRSSSAHCSPPRHLRPTDRRRSQPPLDCSNWRYGAADEPASLPPEFDRNDYKRTSLRDPRPGLHDSPQNQCGQKGSAVDLAWGLVEGLGRRRHRRARLGHQVARRRSDAGPGHQGPHRPGRGTATLLPRRTRRRLQRRRHVLDHRLRSRSPIATATASPIPRT